jgi:ADP-ribosyl-[dinitrogen reductase] hydrolase
MSLAKRGWVPDEDRILGVLLGTAVGDAIGLPFEGLSPHRVEVRLRRRALNHSWIFGRGMISDDTEHACMLAQALIGSRGQLDRFRRGFAWQLRRWLLTLPPGLGFGTLRACLRLCLGFNPARSGVGSAGNGPAMRSALLGVWASDDEQLEAFVQASTRVTHTDPRAEDGPLLVARWAADPSQIGDLSQVRDPMLRERVQAANACVHAGRSVEEARATLGADAGVSGFIVDTIPAVWFCWQRHRREPRAAIEAAIRLGGDTDTVAAIVGGLLGAELGATQLERCLAAVPGEPARGWIEGLTDWPTTVTYMRRLATALARGDLRGPRFRWFGALARNLSMIPIILVHLVARCCR